MAAGPEALVKRLYLDMEAVLEAMATASARFFLDTRTGLVEVALDPDAGEDADHALIPRQRGRSQRARLRQAVAWLAGLGIEAQYQLRASRPRRGARPGEAQVGLVDLLLLGGGDAHAGIVEGRVRRILVADGPERAAKVFARVARELAESCGVRWRPGLVDGKTSYEIDRFRLAVSGRRVELEVQVPPALREIFAGGA
jgi:hypothetical protein